MTTTLYKSLDALVESVAAVQRQAEEAMDALHTMNADVYHMLLDRPDRNAIQSSIPNLTIDLTDLSAAAMWWCYAEQGGGSSSLGGVCAYTGASPTPALGLTAAACQAVKPQA